MIVGSPLSDGTYENQTVVVDESPSLEQLKSLHRCIEKVTNQSGVGSNYYASNFNIRGGKMGGLGTLQHG